MTEKKARVGPAELGLDLSAPTDGVAFRWLIACQLFGARIRQEIAADAWRELDRAGVLTPSKLAKADWQHLVDLLGRGGYRRYDESTARALIANGELMQTRYGGTMSRLREGADTRKALGARLQEFTGVGPTAARIFVREIAGGWKL